MPERTLRALHQLPGKRREAGRRRAFVASEADVGLPMHPSECHRSSARDQRPPTNGPQREHTCTPPSQRNASVDISRRHRGLLGGWGQNAGATASEYFCSLGPSSILSPLLPRVCALTRRCACADTCIDLPVRICKFTGFSSVTFLPLCLWCVCCRPSHVAVHSVCRLSRK